MRKPEIIRPLDIRVFGNVMPHTTNSKGFESFYSKVDYKNDEIIIDNKNVKIRQK